MRLETDRQLATIYETTREELATFLAMIEPNGALLDIGTGGGRYARKAHERGFSPVYGLDIDAHRIEQLKRPEPPRGPRFLSGDILEPPDFGTRFGTIVMMTDTFNFMPEKERVLAMCASLLHDGGLIYISLVKPPEIRSLYRHIYNEDLLQELEREGLSKAALDELLENAGFVPEASREHTFRSMFITRARHGRECPGG